MAALLKRAVKAFNDGAFEGKPVFTGLLQVLISKWDREVSGKGMQNFQYPPGFDDWAHELCCINPEAYRSFKDTFAGRTERSFRDV